jgi:LPS export ABC transporter protein LptC
MHTSVGNAFSVGLGPVRAPARSAGTATLRGVGTLAAAALLTALLGGPVPARGANAADATALEVEGMTFVGSRGGDREVVLRSATASLRPEKNVAELSDVQAELSGDGGSTSVSMTCDHVELDIDTNDFLAEGDVQGETGEGQRYATSWVRYLHADGILYTDAPVEMNDSRGSFRGDGFRYHVHDRRFELLGNVRVEQRP